MLGLLILFITPGIFKRKKIFPFSRKSPFFGEEFPYFSYNWTPESLWSWCIIQNKKYFFHYSSNKFRLGKLLPIIIGWRCILSNYVESLGDAFKSTTQVRASYKGENLIEENLTGEGLPIIERQQCIAWISIRFELRVHWVQVLLKESAWMRLNSISIEISMLQNKELFY